MLTPRQRKVVEMIFDSLGDSDAFGEIIIETVSNICEDESCSESDIEAIDQAVTDHIFRPIK